MAILGTANIGLDSSVGKSAGMSNQRSWVQTLIQSFFFAHVKLIQKVVQIGRPVGSFIVENFFVLLQDLAARAREGKLQLNEFQGGSFR